MVAAPEPSLEELLWTVAMARIILGPKANIQAGSQLWGTCVAAIWRQGHISTAIKCVYRTGTILWRLWLCGMQAPPNLTPLEEGADASSTVQDSWAALLNAGINDWGGLSPLTRDFVNPEKAWPHIAGLAAVTAQAGFVLLPRCVLAGIRILLDDTHQASQHSCWTLHATHSLLPTSWQQDSEQAVNDGCQCSLSCLQVDSVSRVCEQRSHLGGQQRRAWQHARRRASISRCGRPRTCKRLVPRLDIGGAQLRRQSC